MSLSHFHATLYTLYPDMFPGPLAHSLAGKAFDKNIWSFSTVYIRDYADDKHQSVDDKPAGGGAGMVLRADVLGRAIDDHYTPKRDGVLYFMSPRGRPLCQNDVEMMAKAQSAHIICGRFEGVDQRVIDEYQIEEVSIGDYILSGGEMAAMVLLDAIIRLLPNVMGNAQSGANETFHNGLLEYPHYTRPREWQGRAIPDVLLSGDHKAVDQWREDQSLALTRARRPDLLSRFNHDAMVQKKS
jgi:tRNA (guanine37-N1)-methyltransferase